MVEGAAWGGWGRRWWGRVGSRGWVLNFQLAVVAQAKIFSSRTSAAVGSRSGRDRGCGEENQGWNEFGVERWAFWTVGGSPFFKMVETTGFSSGTKNDHDHNRSKKCSCLNWVWIMISIKKW